MQVEHSPEAMSIITSGQHGLVWFEPIGFPGYLVSERAQIISTRGRKPRLLRWNTTNRYPIVHLMAADGKAKTFYVHRLVASLFLEGDGDQVRHLDRNPMNPAMSNLAWGTASQNAMDKVAHGTMPRGDSHWITTVTADQVREIRALRLAGHTLSSIGQRFGVSIQTVSNIARGFTWSHVK